MTKLSEAEIEDILSYLRANQPLPLGYKSQLFPIERYDYYQIKTDSEAVSADKQALVLVVDDSPDNRDLLADLLQFQGHKVAQAANGLEALQMVQDNDIDVVLLDIMMPHMNGYEVLERLKSNPETRHIPVIMISAVSDLDSVIRCVQNGAEDYLQKPFNQTLLKARLSSSLTRKRFQDQEKEYLKMLEAEQNRSERLLLNVLPRAIAERLKQDQETIADSFADVSVLFADIVDFTRLSLQVSAAELVTLLNGIFSAFDALTAEYGLEKIKTVGDSYMVVGGLPDPNPDHVEAVAEMALAMQKSITDFITPDGEPFLMRVGMHVGPVVAGVIGSTKFIYDLWGDTVNTASRMEAYGIPGEIQVTPDVYERLKYKYTFTERGAIPVKGKGEMPAYLIQCLAE